MDGVHLVYGLVTEWKAGFARVQLPTYDDGEGNGIVTDFLPIIKLRSFNDDENWPYEVNEQVACMVDRFCKTGVILGAISSDADPADADAAVGKWRKKFSDGTVMEYDKGAHKYTLNITDSSGEMDMLVGSKTSVIIKDVNVQVTANATTVTVTDGQIESKINNTKLTITDGNVDVKVNSVELAIDGTGGKVDVKDGAGGELSMQAGIFTIKNGSADLGAILTDILTNLQALTVPTGVGPSGPPINLAAFAADAAKVALLLS